MNERIEGLTTIAQVLLRLRGQWQGWATGHEDIRIAVDDACGLISPTGNERWYAVQELITRSGH